MVSCYSAPTRSNNAVFLVSLFILQITQKSESAHDLTVSKSSVLIISLEPSSCALSRMQSACARNALPKRNRSHNWAHRSTMKIEAWSASTTRKHKTFRKKHESWFFKKDDWSKAQQSRPCSTLCHLLLHGYVFCYSDSKSAYLQSQTRMHSRQCCLPMTLTSTS